MELSTKALDSVPPIPKGGGERRNPIVTLVSFVTTSTTNEKTELKLYLTSQRWGLKESSVTYPSLLG